VERLLPSNDKLGAQPALPPHDPQALHQHLLSDNLATHPPHDPQALHQHLLSDNLAAQRHNGKQTQHRHKLNGSLEVHLCNALPGQEQVRVLSIARGGEQLQRSVLQPAGQLDMALSGRHDQERALLHLRNVRRSDEWLPSKRNKRDQSRSRHRLWSKTWPNC
jgi:hypothetical protein